MTNAPAPGSLRIEPALYGGRNTAAAWQSSVRDGPALLPGHRWRIDGEQRRDDET